MNKYTLKAQRNGNVYTYSADTKTDCMYKFDREHFRRGFKFFIIEEIVQDKVYDVKSLSRDYPYQEHILE